MPGLSVNFAQIALRYANICPEKVAAVYRPEQSLDDVGHRRRLTFEVLETRVKRLALALRKAGVRRSDSVAGVLSNTPDAAIAMLATNAIGGVWSSCSPDFGETAVCSRLEQVQPKVLFYTPAYRYKGEVRCVLNNISRIATRMPSVELLICMPPGCCLEGYSILSVAKTAPTGVNHALLRDFEKSAGSIETFRYETMSMDDPVVTMFSSGTTGRPKCIVQGPGILLNQMKEHSLHHEVTEMSTMLYTTSTGWMLFNWVIAALATGCKLVFYDGAAIPDNDPFRLINIANDESVTHFGSGAKYYYALSQIPASHQKVLPKPPVSSLRLVMATGSPSTVDHFDFVRSFFGRGVQYASMSGGTEINGCFALGTPWKPVIAPELQCVGLGMDVAVFSKVGAPVTSERGELVCRNCCPCMPLYFQDDNEHRKYKSSYFERFGPQIWAHGDFASITKNGGVEITGRSDSTLNPGGVRIGTADLYQVVEGLEFVESALVTEHTLFGDNRIVMFVALRHPLLLSSSIEKQIQHQIRSRLSPRHIPYSIVQVPEVPFTFSGKKCEIPVKRILQGREPGNREAVKNPEAFDSIRNALWKKGLLQPSASSTRRVAAFKM
ncbi:unnamed protein product [Chondrus crispus]|uniref:AMP-dependent synthetase/ligase domain-containing protein n=1 Tax=Chondrus crispus TaxID=2769 RepID=R7QIS5_CHOCR|nr:unnamed protein product [Chondrus crispus]CDF37376.1 unnamed protein product [Chondrus crispus]|eukprot:XP_005717195.1 unnamed protein product [Chondrus crispus]